MENVASYLIVAAIVLRLLAFLPHRRPIRLRGGRLYLGSSSLVPSIRETLTALLGVSAIAALALMGMWLGVAAGIAALVWLGLRVVAPHVGHPPVMVDPMRDRLTLGARILARVSDVRAVQIVDGADRALLLVRDPEGRLAPLELPAIPGATGVEVGAAVAELLQVPQLGLDLSPALSATVANE